jgi:hypothetical protein
MRPAALVLLLFAASARAESGAGADDHMLTGAQHFQAGRFTEALVEFRVAERLGDATAAWYTAAALVKLKRPEDALSEFARAAATAPLERDALLDYYHALACYDARLYFCADRLLTAVRQEAGPRIAAQAQQIRADLQPILAALPPTAAIDWYHARAQAALKSRRAPLAAASFEEAKDLAALRPDGYRGAEAIAGVATSRGAPAATASSP